MLKGKKIYLRGVEFEDVELIESIENDSNNWLHSGTTLPFSKKTIEEYILSIRDLYSDKQSRWIICLHESDQSIGAIDLFEFDGLNRRAGVGIIIDEKYRNKGYAKEAIELLSNYAFSYLNLHQLWSTIVSSNTASQKLFENCNFRKTATKKNWIVNNGSWLDEYFYQLINPNSI